MGYFINGDTNNEIFYHGQKSGIDGKLSINKNQGSSDFGNGFYLGTKKIQTLSRVVSELYSYAYECEEEGIINGLYS